MHGQCDAKYTVIFPADAGTKYCLVTEAHCEQLPMVAPESEAAGNRTRDLLIATPAPS